MVHVLIALTYVLFSKFNIWCVFIYNCIQYDNMYLINVIICLDVRTKNKNNTQLYDENYIFLNY